ncbi:nuclear transport factor 2 family protein [Rhodococcus erythropolis]|uniref:nuclear transport factor 2 family protein n=1 Tax=Rhodococcus erythropolis TaxID=1833 RepID=UPI0029491C60|nr:nuclear transport factor 2 family protein [Rhodococcus erythropolis]MDV6276542.1 nuclear transport factor 2 family protein [Rhodococcus erythropolis]
MSNTADTNTAAVVDSFFTRFGTGDVPGLIDLFADTFDFVVNGAPNIPWSGRRSTRAELADFFNSFGQVLAPAEVYAITATVIDGENAVMLGHNKFEVLATGKSFTNDFALHMTVEGGKITTYRMHEDSYAISAAFVI